jgi:hypothetical protein
MNGHNDIYVPDCHEFVRGYQLYNERECRGPIWFEAFAIVRDHWGDSRLMSKGVGIIIRGWNRFYAGFDADALTTTIETNLNTLGSLCTRDINSYAPDDRTTLLLLFNAFQEALKRNRDNRISPVSVGKALSLFAPSFFPLWDSNIAYAYHCAYAYRGGKEYLSFMDRMKLLAESVEKCVPKNDDRPLLKRIDEYNYSKYTKHWI